MFDDQMKNQPDKTGQPPADLPKVEDIFADSETKAQSSSPFKPVQPPTQPPAQSGQVQPTQPAKSAVDQMPDGISQAELFGGRSILENKVLVAAMLVIAAVVVGTLVWFGYVWFTNRTIEPVPEPSSQTVVTTEPSVIPQPEPAPAPTPEPEPEPVMAKDSDFDGLTDDQERDLGTDHLKADSDGDGLIDYAEVNIYLSNPLDVDTDDDGYNDGKEVTNGFDPTRPGNALLPAFDQNGNLKPLPIPTPDEPDYNVFSNETYSIYFEYPKDWPTPKLEVKQFKDTYPTMPTNWYLVTGPDLECQDEGCILTRLYINVYPKLDYLRAIDDLNNMQFVSEVSEGNVNGMQTISYKESGMAGSKKTMIFGPNYSLVLNTSMLNIDDRFDAYMQIINSLNLN